MSSTPSTRPSRRLLLAGVDVSAKTLDVAFALHGEKDSAHAVFHNDIDGHKRLARMLRRRSRRVRVVVEATGAYSTALLLYLSARKGVEVMRANPRAMKHFAEAVLRRGKTDKMDALVHLEFARRMEFRPFVPPSQVGRELRSLTRRRHDLVGLRTQEKNRSSAARVGREPNSVVSSIVAMIDVLDRSIAELEDAIRAFIQGHEELERQAQLLLSIPGIGETTAATLLGEFLHFDPEMDVRQLVALAGLDPRPYRSGTSVKASSRISKRGNKHIRSALYWPAVTAVRTAPEVRRFHDRLVNRGKKGLQPTVAVMRKLLHAAHGILKSGQPYDPARFTPLACPVPADVEPASAVPTQIGPLT